MNEKKMGVVLSYAGQFIHILTGIIYTPIMLRLLGKSEYGLYQLVYSVVSYLSLLSLGFAGSYMRFYSREKANDDQKGVAKINGMFLVIFLVMSFICVICGLGMVANIRCIFGSGLSEEEYTTARVLMILMVVNLALTFPNSIFNCIITSQEKFLFQKLLALFQYLLNPFLTLPLLIAGYGTVGMVSISTVLIFVVLICNIYYCFRKIHSKFSFLNLQFSLLKEMWIFTFFIFLNQIVDQINWSVDKLLLGRLAGTVSVAVYGVGSQINNLYIQFSSSVSSVFVPRVNRIVAETGDNEELTIIFTKVGRIQFMIMYLILSGFVFFGKLFIYYWAGEEYGEAYDVTLLLILPVTVPLIQNLGIEIQRAKNKHKARSVVYFFIAIANIFVSIPLINIFGPTGAALGTTLSLVGGNIIFMNWYYHNRLGINIKYFWKNIVKIAPAFIVPGLCGIILMRIEYKNVISLAIGIIVYTFIYSISLYFFGMNKEEKSIVEKPIRKVLGMR